MMISIAMKTTRSVMNNDGVVISRAADREGPARRSGPPGRPRAGLGVQINIF